MSTTNTDPEKKEGSQGSSTTSFAEALAQQTTRGKKEGSVYNALKAIENIPTIDRTKVVYSATRQEEEARIKAILKKLQQAKNPGSRVSFDTNGPQKESGCVTACQPKPNNHSPHSSATWFNALAKKGENS